MKSLESRIADLEGAHYKADLKSMTDDELETYIGTLESWSSPWYGAVIANVMRHPSTFPIVEVDPD